MVHHGSFLSESAFSPDEQLAGLQVVQVEELPHARRPPQVGQRTQVREVLLERPAPLSDGFRREVPAQLLSWQR